MKPQHYIPALMILLDVGASIVYLYNKEYRMAVYWLAAGVLTLMVTME